MITLNNTQTERFTVYLINKEGENKPCYVGMSQQFKKRAYRHTTLPYPTQPLYQAMSEFGVEGFSFTIFAQYNDKEAAERMENKLIQIVKPQFNQQLGKRTIKGYNFNTKQHLEVHGLTNMERLTGVNTGRITAILNGTKHSYNGWMFTTDDQPDWVAIEAKAIEKYFNSSPKQVRGTNLKTGEVVQFESVSEASRWLNVNLGQSAIVKNCKGQRLSAYGFKWEYLAPQQA